MANRKGDLDLSRLENLDRLTRDKWVNAIAYIFITMKPSTVAIEIANQGFPKFLSLASEGFANQDLHVEDFRRIFDKIKQAAERKAQVRIH